MVLIINGCGAHCHESGVWMGPRHWPAEPVGTAGQSDKVRSWPSEAARATDQLGRYGELCSHKDCLSLLEPRPRAVKDSKDWIRDSAEDSYAPASGGLWGIGYCQCTRGSKTGQCTTDEPVPTNLYSLEPVL